jgi:hypothetical protein
MGLRNVALTDPGFGKDCWPEPEIGSNVNEEEPQEHALVAFMRTLTDGHPDRGQDPRVPPGTASPFAQVLPPPAP